MNDRALDDLRRILLASLGILLALAAAGLVIMAWTPDRKLDIDMGGFDLEAFIDTAGGARLAFTVVMGTFMGLGVSIFTLALWPDREEVRDYLLVRRPDGTVIRFDAPAIEAIVREAVEQLPDALTATPRARILRHTVELEVDVVTRPAAVVDHVAAAVAYAAEDVLREQLFLDDVRRPQVRIRYAPREQEDLTRPPGVPAFAWPSIPEPPGRSGAGRLTFPGPDPRDD
jgi:hypothetical protein